MNHIDDENVGYLYSLYYRVLSYGEWLQRDGIVRMPLRTMRDVAARVLARRHPLRSPLLEASQREAASTSSEPRGAPAAPSSAERAVPAAEPFPPPPVFSKIFWCCTPGFEAAAFSLCALDFGPIVKFVTAAMEASIKDISYFTTDTAAYIVSKLWDDFWGAEIFKMTTVFLCSEDYDRPCNRPAAAGVQLRYSFVMALVCAIIKVQVESKYAKQNRGTLIIPGMLGMLVGWTFGRTFQELRVQAEAVVLGCDTWGPATHVAGNAFDWIPILTGKHNHDGGPAPDGQMECLVLAASDMTVRFRIFYAFCITIGSSLIILLLEPAAALEEFGSSAWRREIGVRFKSLVQLLSKAAATTSMILWNDACTGAATKDIEHSQTGVRIRMLLFYSMAITFGGSAVSIQFQSWSRHLSALAETTAKAAAEQATAKREVAEAAQEIEGQLRQLSECSPNPGVGEGVADGHARGSPLSQRDSGTRPVIGSSTDRTPAPPMRARANPDTFARTDSLRRLLRIRGTGHLAWQMDMLRARTEETKAGIGATLDKLKLRMHFIAASLRTLAVLEGTLGWVAGCAWTDWTVAVYPTIATFPDTPWVLFANVRVAIGLSVVAIAWITFTGNNEQTHAGSSGERESRERIFIGGAFSFFTGWAWISVVRCVWVMPYALIQNGTLPHLTGGARDSDDVEDAWRHGSEMVISLIFCPAATWLVIRAALSTKTAYEKRAGMGVWKQHVTAIRAFSRAREEMNRKNRVRNASRLPEMLL